MLATAVMFQVGDLCPTDDIIGQPCCENAGRDRHERLSSPNVRFRQENQYPPLAPSRHAATSLLGRHSRRDQVQRLGTKVRVAPQHLPVLVPGHQRHLLNLETCLE
jgi:hypothetical protein